MNYFKNKKINKVAQEIANILMLINFNFNSDIKIKSFFHFLMLFVSNGHNICNYISEISVNNNNNKNKFKIIFGNVIVPMICSDTISIKASFDETDIDTNNRKYIELANEIKKWNFYHSDIINNLPIKRQYNSLKTINYVGLLVCTTNTQTNNFINSLISCFKKSPPLDYFDYSCIELDSDFLNLIAKYFKINYDEAIKDYNEHEENLIVQQCLKDFLILKFANNKK